jgi:thiosulfate dehydrogenase [quinone] large subunit
VASKYARAVQDLEHVIAVIRIGLGIEFVAWSWAKMQEGWLQSGAALTRFLAADSGRAPGLYNDFLAAVVLPNAGLFAQLVTLGELAAGLSLAFGILTRLGAATGMWLVLNFMLMRGVVGIEASIDRIFFLACLGCLVVGAGRVWGLDGRIRALAESSNRRALRLAGTMA